MTTFDVIKIFSGYVGQYYTDENWKYYVPDMGDYAEKHLKPMDVDPLKIIAQDQGESDEPVNSPEFQERAMDSDLSYPILLVEYQDHFGVADGRHRLYKARFTNIRSIPAYIFNEEDLRKVPRQPAPKTEQKS